MNESIISVAMSADGQTIVSGGEDGTIRVWKRHGQPRSKTFQAMQESSRSHSISYKVCSNKCRWGKNC